MAIDDRTQEGVCAACRAGNHDKHQPQWAGICIGCACPWTPDENEEQT